MQSRPEAWPGDVDQLHRAEHGGVDGRPFSRHPPLKLRPGQSAGQPEGELELEGRGNFAPVRTRHGRRAGQRPPAGRGPKRCGQPLEHMLDSRFRLIDPVVGHVFRDRNSVHIEDHPRARAILKGRQPRRGIAVDAVRLELVPADQLGRDSGARLGSSLALLRAQETESRTPVARIELAGGAADHGGNAAGRHAVERGGEGVDAVDRHLGGDHLGHVRIAALDEPTTSQVIALRERPAARVPHHREAVPLAGHACPPRTGALATAQ
jgi:hypothetical protein